MTKTGARDAGPAVAPAPPGRGRIRAIDAARAVAIVGMLAVNVGPKDGEGVWGRVYALPYGRASLLFVLIAGIGVSLLTRRVRGPAHAGLGRDLRGAWGSLLWRAAILLLAGLALQLLDHEASVILPTYAVLFVLAGVLLRAPSSVLLAVAAVLAVLGPAVWLGVQLVNGTTYTYEPAALGDPLGQTWHSIVLSGPYPLITWSAPFVFGMWLGRQNLTDRRHRRAMIVVGAALTLLALVISDVATAVLGEPADAMSPGMLLTSAPHGQMPLWLIGGTASAVLVLGLCLQVSHLMEGSLWPLVATGQLSLTIYVGHLLALHWLRPAPHDLAQGVLITVVMTVAAVGLACLWRSAFPRGPLEVLVRPPWTWARR